MRQVIQPWSATILSGLLLCFSVMSQAALPAQVAGQPVPSLAPMLKQTTPAVVNIATKGLVEVANNPLMNDPFFEFFFNLPQAPRQRKTQSLGSGVIVDAQKGYIITNHHVIEHAKEITVTLNDGRQFDAQLIGSDDQTDVAVIQIKAKNLTSVPWGNSDQIEVGDFVVAIGNPFGLGQTVTSGIVSALGRTNLGIEGYEDFIQTDASINPGNSGGALVDLNGQLVGINTAILAPSGGNVGIGFAIPANMTRSLMDQLIQFGEIRRGLLGVSIQDFTPELASAFGATMVKAGAIITEVNENSPAEKAGLKPGDVVITMNDRNVRSGSDLRNQIGLLRVGAKATLVVLREGKRKTIKTQITAAESLTIAGDNLHPNLKGATFGSTGKNGNKENSNIVILSVKTGSPAWRTGLRKEDIIVSANRVRVSNTPDLEEAIKSSGRNLLLHVRRGREAFYLVIK